MTTTPCDPWHAPYEPCSACDSPDPAPTAEQKLADVLDLLAIYEQRPIGHQWIRPETIRQLIDGGAR